MPAHGLTVLEVHDRGDRRPERLLAEIPGRAPGQAVVGAIGDLGHPGQADVAPLGQDRGIEMAGQVRAPGLATAGVLEAAAEAGPAVHLDQQLAQLHLGQPLIDKLFEDHGALRSLFRFERGDDEVSVLHPDARVAVQQGIDPLQERLQLGLALRQTRRALVGDLELLAHLAAQGGPTILGDQVRLRVGVATAGFQPDIAGPQGRAQLREHAELEVAPVDPSLAVDHVGTPLRRDEIDGGASGASSGPAARSAAGAGPRPPGAGRGRCSTGTGTPRGTPG